MYLKANFLFVFLIIASISLKAQFQNPDLQPKQSIGLSIEPQITEFINDPTPTFKLDYQRLLNENNAFGASFLRVSFIYKPSFSSSRHAIGGSIGWNKSLYRSDKFNIYGGVDLRYLNYERKFVGSGIGDRTSIIVNSVDLNLFGGIEYNASNNVSFFLEPSIMSTTLYESTELYNSFEPTNLKFLSRSTFGVRMKF